MKNRIQEGLVMEYTNASGSTITSGSLVIVGARAGVAVVDIANGAKGSLYVDEVFELPKLSSDAISQGALVYWDATPGEVTTTASGNTLIGYAFEAAASSTTKCRVKLNG